MLFVERRLFRDTTVFKNIITFKNTYYSRQSKMNNLHLENVVFQLTRQCELECPHCFFDSSPDAASMLTAQQAFLAVDDVSSAGLEVGEFILTGGEPTIWPQVSELIKKIRQQNSASKVRIDTNGINLFRDESLFEKLGADIYHLSIDFFHATGLSVSIKRGYLPPELQGIILEKDGYSRLVDYFLEQKERWRFELGVRWTSGFHNQEGHKFLERYGKNPLIKIEVKPVTATGRAAANLPRKVIGKGYLVSEAPDNFKCLMGSSFLLSVNGNWYACYHPVEHTKIGELGSLYFVDQLTKIRESPLYDRLPREGIIKLLQEIKDQHSETESEVNVVLSKNFWYRCQPCVTASECGLFNYFSKGPALRVT